MSVGMPQTLLLQEFGEHVLRAFGHVCYHVGSSLNEKQWRDVDVRLLIPDEEYEAMGLGHPERSQQNKRWCSLVYAWSTFGRQLTGLPIDFQIQQQSYANRTEAGKSRSALFRLCEMVDHVAYARYNRDGEETTVELCDSDAPGCFQVYRKVGDAARRAG